MAEFTFKNANLGGQAQAPKAQVAPADQTRFTQQEVQKKAAEYTQMIQQETPFQDPFAKQTKSGALGGMAQIWQSASGSNFQQIPDGEYAAIIEKFQVSNAKSGKPKVAITYKTIDGKGGKEFQHLVLQNEQGEFNERNIGIIKQTLSLYGISPEEGFAVIEGAYEEFLTQNSSLPVSIDLPDNIGVLTIRTVTTAGRDPYRNVSFKLQA